MKNVEIHVQDLADLVPNALSLVTRLLVHAILDTQATHLRSVMKFQVRNSILENERIVINPKII